MTIKLEIRRAADVFADNEVMLLRGEARLRRMRIAGVAWLVEGEPVREAHRRSLSEATSLVMTKLAGYALYLLAAHSTWQPDSRVIRHRKLWGSLKARGLTIPDGREVEEGLVETSEGLRFFSALRLGSGPVDPVVAILEDEPASHLVALDTHADGVASELARSGWRRPPFGPSMDVLGAVCGVDGVVFWPIGRFDDREAGCAAFARTPVLNGLLR
jgi:hypothetical protein